MFAARVHLSTGSTTEMEGLHRDFASRLSHYLAFFCNSIQNKAWIPVLSCFPLSSSPLFSHHHSGGTFRRYGYGLSSSTGVLKESFCGLENCSSSTQKPPEDTQASRNPWSLEHDIPGMEQYLMNKSPFLPCEPTPFPPRLSSGTHWPISIHTPPYNKGLKYLPPDFYISQADTWSLRGRQVEGCW